MENVYVEENEKLKKEWKEKRPKGCMIWDGIICPHQWYHSDLKLMFIAREAYDKDEDSEDWDIAEEWNWARGLFKVKKPASQTTHYKTACWTYAIDLALRNKEVVFEEDARNNDFQPCRKIMLGSAFINIKKVGGKSRSDINELRRIVCEDKELLSKQIEIINPNVVYLCGKNQINILDVIFDGKTKIAETELCYDWNGRLLISYYHPAYYRIGIQKSMDVIFNDVKKIPNKIKYLHQ